MVSHLNHVRHLKAWLEHMVGLFGYCNEPLVESLNKIADGDGKVEMEEKFCSVGMYDPRV